jgi:FixJ family two-component response regulator
MADNSARSQSDANPRGVRPIVYIVSDDVDTLSFLRGFIERLASDVEEFDTFDHFVASYDRSRVGCLVLDSHDTKGAESELQCVLDERGVVMPTIALITSDQKYTLRWPVERHVPQFYAKPIDPDWLLFLIAQEIEPLQRERDAEVQIDFARQRLTQLATDERQVLDLIVQGLSCEEIARRLNMSLPTVEGHQKTILLTAGTESVPQLARIVRSKPGVTAQQRLAHLTPDEQQVLELLFEGYLCSQIASRLNMSVPTVEGHRKTILYAGGVESIGHLWAIMEIERRADRYSKRGALPNAPA